MRAILWLYADMPLDFDRHRRMGWAHAVLVVGHGGCLGDYLFYREASPLARWCSTRAHLHLVLFLLSVKVVVFADYETPTLMIGERRLEAASSRPSTSARAESSVSGAAAPVARGGASPRRPRALA